MAIGAVLLLSSCVPGPNPAIGTGEEPAGFLLGLWHGIISPITFVISLFTNPNDFFGSASLYEVRNSGNWYDSGFYLGLTMLLGGGGFWVGSKRRR